MINFNYISNGCEFFCYFHMELLYFKKTQIFSVFFVFSGISGLNFTFFCFFRGKPRHQNEHFSAAGTQTKIAQNQNQDKKNRTARVRFEFKEGRLKKSIPSEGNR